MSFERGSRGQTRKLRSGAGRSHTRCLRGGADIQECFLLEVREPATGDIKLFLDLRLSDPELSLAAVAGRLQEALGKTTGEPCIDFVTAGTFPVPSDDALFRRHHG